jgi:hypothetical protein
MPEEAAVRAFASILEREGLHAALAYLNSRTPHRCTAVYRYGGDVMRNVLLYDRMDPQARHGIDVALADAYCGQVAARGNHFEFSDTRLLPASQQCPHNPVVCYCGVVIPGPAGAAWGTLCHYDFKPCQMRKSDIPLLQAVVHLVHEHAARDLAQAMGPGLSPASP